MKRIKADIAASAQLSMAKMRHRLERTTTRERVLLCGLIIGAALYAPVYALETQSTQSEAYMEALSDQAAARLAAQSARRIQNSAADTALIEDMKAWGFKAQNPAIAQVMIEYRLTSTAEDVGLINPVITTQSKVEAEGPTHWMFAEVTTDLRWGPAFAFINALGEWPEGFRVTDFRYEVLPPLQGRNITTPPADRGTITYSLAFPVIVEDLPEMPAQAAQSRRLEQGR